MKKVNTIIGTINLAMKQHTKNVPDDQKALLSRNLSATIDTLFDSQDPQTRTKTSSNFQYHSKSAKIVANFVGKSLNHINEILQENCNSIKIRDHKTICKSMLQDIVNQHLGKDEILLETNCSFKMT